MFFCVAFIFVWIIPMIIEWIGSVDWTGKYNNPANIPNHSPLNGKPYFEIKEYDFNEENRKIIERLSEK